MARRRFTRDHRERAKEPRINERINAPKLRVVIEGEGQKVMTRDDAVAHAKSLGLDLVEISPDQDPPVCKIIDYGKYKYEQQKKKKEASKNQHTVNVKEVKMRPKIAGNDYDLKKRNAMRFLGEGDKVKVSLRFRGREITHPEIGMRLMEKLATDLAEYATVETPAKMEGRQIIMVLASKTGPKKKGPDASGSPEEKGIDEKKAAESVTTSSGT